MPRLRKLCCMALGLAAVSTALPAQPKLSHEVRDLYDRSVQHLAKRQNPATGLPDGLGDVDILQFAMTLENLETAFYQQGFAKFPATDFQALGLSDLQISDLISIGSTEQEHVTTLLSAIAQAGVQPVAPCVYNFGFTDAAGMVAIAGVLENVGVSAYLGAAPLIKSSSILTVAAQIMTVESRHQTFVRTASQVIAVPSAFDTPLGIRTVFTLAAQFISSCPKGSNLAITPFPPLTMTSPSAGSIITAGTQLSLSTSASGGTFCSFTNGGLPGGSVFTALVNGQCTVPQNLAGITYLHVTNDGPLTGAFTDAIAVAGPLVLQL